jgi:hypothetical protein
MLNDQLQHADNLVTVLPSMLSLIAHSTNDEYRNKIRPHFTRVFTMTRPMQVSITDDVR